MGRVRDLTNGSNSQAHQNAVKDRRDSLRGRGDNSGVDPDGRTLRHCVRVAGEAQLKPPSAVGRDIRRIELSTVRTHAWPHGNAGEGLAAGSKNPTLDDRAAVVPELIRLWT